MRNALPLLLALTAFACGPSSIDESARYDIEEKTIARLRADLDSGTATSEELVQEYLARIEELDIGGPALRSVLAVNPGALEAARTADRERRDGKPLGLLHGIPILLKDNIESSDPLPTTAGSLALKDNFAGEDAPVVARLRAAGAIILGKANLSEWANFRSTYSSSGWSAVGGLTRNPYVLDRSACGSSSGSGAAVSANLAAAAIGTETDGSVTCPSAINGLVGLKPTLGLLPRTGIVPIAHSQDTAGPMTRTVEDAALLLSVMTGADDRDPVTAEADLHRINDYRELLLPDSLRGKRFGVMRFAMGYHPQTDALFNDQLIPLRAAGARFIDIDDFDDMATIEEYEFKVLLTEFKADLNDYLSGSPERVTVRSLAELIKFNAGNKVREMPFFDQNLFTMAEASGTLDDPDYRKALGESRRLAGPDGVDRLLAEFQVDALIAPTTSPAWTFDLVNGDHYLGSATTLAAVSGYPHVTVPLGQVRELPVGLSLIGPAWSDARLLTYAYAVEQILQARRQPAFLPTLAAIPAVQAGMERNK